MKDPGADPSRRNRMRTMLLVGGSLAIAGVIVVGVLAAGRGEPARVSLPDVNDPAPLAQASESGTATAEAPPKAAPKAAPKPTPKLKGSGAPIRISGTDPITGKAVSLDQFTGKPVVLAIWASWCHGCNEEGPHVSKVAAARGDVHFVGLNYADDVGGAKGFYDKYGWRFPSIADPSGSIAAGLGLQGTPTTIFLDSDHREIGRILGATDAAGFEAAVDQITAL